jgi:transposase-like protein
MERDKLDQLAEELTKRVTSEKNLSASFLALMRKTLERTLEAEMDIHLGYGKH